MPKKINLRGFIGFDDQATPEFLERELTSANGEDILLEINSGGGFVFDGLEMANMIRNYSGHVTARVVGLAASMASYIPMMADHIEVEDNTVFMIHNPFGVAFGDHRDMEAMAEFMESLSRLLAKAYAAQTGKTLEEISTLMDEETFLFAEEIVDEGFADEVVGESDNGDLDADAKSKAIMAAKAEISDCKDLMDEAAKEKTIDVKKIAALMGAAKPKNTEAKPKTTEKQPVKAEQKTMTWQEFLAQNPEAKADHEKSIEAAKAEGVETGRAEAMKVGRESMNAALDAALPILSSASYPETVKNDITEKLKAGDTASITATASALDMMAESQKSKQAEGEQGDETPADNPGENSGSNFQEIKDRIKTNYGV